MKVASGRTAVPRPASSNSLQLLDQNEADNRSGSGSPFRLSYTVLQEKRARKAAEDDAVRLCNRVKQLQKEAERASKRVSDTKKRIQDVRTQQQRVVDKQVIPRAQTKLSGLVELMCKSGIQCQMTLRQPLAI